MSVSTNVGVFFIDHLLYVVLGVAVLAFGAFLYVFNATNFF